MRKFGFFWNFIFRSSIDNVHTVPYYLIVSCVFYELDYRLGWTSSQYESCVDYEWNTRLPVLFLVTVHWTVRYQDPAAFLRRERKTR